MKKIEAGDYESPKVIKQKVCTSLILCASGVPDGGSEGTNEEPAQKKTIWYE